MDALITREHFWNSYFSTSSTKTREVEKIRLLGGNAGKVPAALISTRKVWFCARLAIGWRKGRITLSKTFSFLFSSFFNERGSTV